MKKMNVVVSLALIFALILPFGMSAGAYTVVPLSANLVSRGYSHSGIVTKDGSLYMWGSNRFGQVGNASSENRDNQYTPVKIMDNVKSVSLGHSSSAAIKKDGSLWIWGAKSVSVPLQFGGFETTHKVVFSPEKILDDVVSVSMGNYVYAAVKADGSLWAWGSVYALQDTEQVTDTPVKVMDDVVSVACGYAHIAALKSDGSLWTWGSGQGYAIGDGTDETRKTPYKVMDDVVSVSCCDFYTSALKKDGSLWMWGYNNSLFDTYHRKTLGVEDTHSPTKVMDDVKSVFMGTNTYLVIKTDNSLWTLGIEDPDKNITDGSHYAGLKKVMENVVTADTGYLGYTAVKEDGSVWVWGSNEFGQLGLGKNVGDVILWKGATMSGTDECSYKTTPEQLTEYKVSVPQQLCVVNFELNGATGTTMTLCTEGELLVPCDNPYKDGYFFAGWYKDKDCTKLWNFDTDYVSENCTLYAKWLPKTTATVIAEPSTQEVLIDGKDNTFSTYILRDKNGFAVNFVKLRDVAYLLDGSKAQFNVEWRSNAIRLDPNSAYTGRNGAEFTVPTVVSAPAKKSLTPVLTNGVSAPLEAFLLIDENGGGHTYFKLRDIGKVAGFNVEWDSSRECVVIKTTEKYSE